jgi:tetratricopeptide (TPR) repeat protein
VTKDNLLFATIGILLGFISGYLMHEAMSARQAPRLWPGQAAANGAPGTAAPPMGNPGGNPAGAPPGDANSASGQAAMQEIQALRQQVEEHPDDAEAVLRLANANFDIQNWSRAKELYIQYLKLEPAHPDVLTDLGIVYRSLREPDRALELFDQAQKLAPQHWQSLFNKVLVLAFDQQKAAEADQALSALQKLQPGNPDVDRLAAEVAKRSSAP